MAATPTARLGLNKQAYQDPSWHTNLDAGFDNADARLLKISSDHGNAPDPNTLVAGDYVGQRYLDETANPPRWWVCSTAGVAAAAVWELLGTTGVYTSVAKNGNQNLETILADYQTRLAALEALDLTPPILADYIEGLELARTGNDTFTIEAGKAGASDGSRLLIQSSQWSKDWSASWVPGTGNGCMSSSLNGAGHPQNNGTYHVFIMYKSAGDVTDIGVDTSITAANLQTDHGFEKFHHIMDLIADTAGADIIDFHQCGDYVEWDSPKYAAHKTGWGGGLIQLDGEGTWVVAVPDDVPVIINASCYGEGYGAHIRFGTPAGSNPVPEIAIGDGPIGMGIGTYPFSFQTLTDANQQIEGNISSGTPNIWITVHSFIHPRGRNYPYTIT